MKPVIIGAGLAGLTAALALAPAPVTLLSSRKLGEDSSSLWAQGGIAAAIGADDSPRLHTEDTLKAGTGLCEPAVARQVTEDALSIIERLTQQGVVFDRDAAGQLRLGLEGAHKSRRIVHAAGDGTGAAVMKALITAVRATPSIDVIEDAVVVDILADNVVRGVRVLRNGQCVTIPAHQVVLATGGAGALWKYTTNPLESWGRGLALAARAGAVLGDLEFMQFHPTAMDVGRDPMPLASEALRGEGARLIDEHGRTFVDELQPRDIVARAIWNHMAQGHHVFLDAQQAIGQSFSQRFPAVYKLCIESGIDPTRQPIPVRPGAHYHMGGVVTDASGRSNVKGLWACGEVACTGLHGANRLASNSLLEAASFGQRVAEDILGIVDQETENQKVQGKIRRPHSLVDDCQKIRTIMSQYVGMVRDRAGLEIALQQLAPLAHQSDMALTSLMIATAALRREESRGAHARSDYPLTSPAWQKRITLTLDDVLMKPESSLAAGI